MRNKTYKPQGNGNGLLPVAIVAIWWPFILIAAAALALFLFPGLLEKL
jgi:hypothetical protein